MANIEKRISNDDKISYRVKVRLKGFPAQSATFERLTDAKKWAQQTEAAIREGRHFKTTEAKRHTLADSIDRYLQNVIPTKPNSARCQTQQLNWWKDSIGDYSLAEVTPALIAQQREKLIKGTTPRGKLRTTATVNRYLAVLSHLFTIASKEWGWIEQNPLTKVTKLKESRGRVRFLSDDERTQLLFACQNSESPYLYLIVVIALSTGARRMEILGLKWSQVDLNRGVITLHETKNGERRILPLVGHANQLMKEHAKVRHINIEIFYNRVRMHSANDYMLPVDYEMLNN